jgi:cell division protein ZapA
MAQINLSVGGRMYPLACKDGEEPHLYALAEVLDAKVQQAISTLGYGNEMRLLLTGGLLLADEMHEAKLAKGAGNPSIAPSASPGDLSGLTRLAERLERLAISLEERST